MARTKKEENLNEVKVFNEGEKETNTDTSDQPKTDETVKTSKKKKLTLNDSVSITVSNNLPNSLIYINHKTGDLYTWEVGDTQDLYVSDIRAMKSNQRKFLEDNWISIEGIADKNEDYEGVEVDEILDALQISQYYKNKLYPKNLNEIFNWKNDEIKLKVPKMPKSIKQSIVIKANDLIKSGIIDSISKVKALEEALDCQLASPDEE